MAKKTKDEDNGKIEEPLGNVFIPQPGQDTLSELPKMVKEHIVNGPFAERSYIQDQRDEAALMFCELQYKLHSSKVFKAAHDVSLQQRISLPEGRGKGVGRSSDERILEAEMGRLLEQRRLEALRAQAEQMQERR